MRPNPIRQLWANGKPALNCKGFDFVTMISDKNLLAHGAAERVKLNA
jgi:hypothetical protein